MKIDTDMNMIEDKAMKTDIHVLPSSTQFGEIGSAYPEFTIIVAIGLRNPMLNRNQAQMLYLYDVY
jgi:hypothetical protein